MQQGTPEWFAARAGKATASRIADIVAKTKTGYSASRDRYAVELTVERITGAKAEGYTNAAMQWGTEQEPLARAAYEAMTGELVEEVGMVDHPRIAMSGASPDGLVGSDGLIEIKCPDSHTHVRNLVTEKPDGRYISQMQWQMACTGRKWCDFVSFDPRMPQGLQLSVVRVQRDDVLIAELESEVEKFLALVEEMVQSVMTKKAA